MSSQVSDQFSALQYTVPQAGKTPITAPLSRPAVDMQSTEAKSVLRQPQPLQPITRRESTEEDVVEDTTRSTLSPEEIDELVNDLFENSQRKPSGLTELPVGESIEFDDPIGDVADELNTDQENASEPDNTETGEVDAPQLNLSMVPDESATVVAQQPAASISQPFRIAHLSKADDFVFTGNGPDSQSVAADQTAFAFEPVTRLRAVPVDKWDQRLAGVPISENRTKYPRSHLSFLPDSNSSLLVLPARNPRSMTPGTQLESMDFRSFSEQLSVEGDSMESHSSLPKIHEVIR